ncbi:SpoIIE family protein phosphatase [Terasakiella sp. A23]|uniref:SpoIIE family protein phosphatase n=1 Tax=Terasakiella sp. FCG-A23 TaxID=3080561 RepID=UPI00295347F0|nr:SpoIIE family protein phosphatase [Terasakiella sp. A23]MDV7338916.1 SpoIIE family protein phosphatase [Terasakiella sp. A23]
MHVKSLTIKILAIFIPLVMIAEVAVFAIQSVMHYREQEKELLSNLKNLINVQSTTLAQFVWEYDDDSLKAALDQIVKLPYIRDVAILDEVGGTPNFSKGPYDQPAEKKEFRLTRDIVYFEQTEGRTVGILVVTGTGQQIQSELEEKLQVTAIVLVVLLFALIGAALIANKLFIGRPLTLLRDAIDKQSGQLGQAVLVDWQSKDELGHVIEAYNGLQQRLLQSGDEISRYQNHLKDLVNQRTAEIHASIKYASRIQKSLLPSNAILKQAVSEHFVIWEPRDIVGGDLYWCRLWGDGHLIVLGDCTGHGVPGALMTQVFNSALERAELETQPGECEKLMQTLNKLMRKSLGQDTGETQTDDGIELGLIYITDKKQKMHFVGARVDLYCVSDGQVKRIKATRKGVGYPEIPENQTYIEHIFEPEQNTTYYMTTDGFVDQVGGPRRMMFGRKRFQKLLSEISQFPIAEQSGMLLKELSVYQGHEVRRDDVSLIGFKVQK